MTTVHNLTIKEYTYFNVNKRPDASLQYLILILTRQTIKSTNSNPSIQTAESIKTEAT
jgi:hypothetical protein